MAKYKVSLKMPVIALSVGGEYSRFKKPTGLENLILTAIGTPALKSDTWREFFARIAVPDRMIPLFKKVIDNLCMNGVINMNGFNPDDRISLVTFTETGRDLFEQGRIKQEPKTFRENVFYLPYAKTGDEPFVFAVNPSNDEGFDSSRFQDVGFDEDDLHKFLVKNKKHIGADDEDEILSVNLDCPPEIQCIKKEVYLQFDETSGNFYFESGVDSNFIKGHYTSEDLVMALDDIRGNPKNMILNAIAEVPEGWESVRYDLPKDFTLKGRFCVFNTELCTTIGSTPVDELEGAFADITGASIGREYLMVNKQASVFGLKGTVDIPVLVSRSLSKEDIVSLFDLIAESVVLTKYDAVMSFLDKSAILNDDEYQLRMVRKHLDAKEDLTNTLIKLSNVKANWAKGLPTIIEQHMFDSDRSLETVVSMLEASSFKLGCDTLADKYRTGDLEKDIIVADKLIKVSKAPGVISVKLGINQYIADSILDGRQGDYTSMELQAANIVSAKLSDLRKMFSVESPEKYDISAFQDSQTEAMMGDYSSMAKAVTVVGPLIRGTDGEKQLERYLDLFQNLNEIYGRDVPLERLNGYQFGIGIRRKTETVLRNILKTSDMLAGLIEAAAKKQIVSDDELEVLGKIKNYGNICAHTTDVPPVDSKEKQRWIRLVKEIEKRSA